MKLDTMRDLYTHEIRDLYDAETRFLETLPRMAERCSDTELKEVLNAHVEETREHRTRLEQICRDLEVEPAGETCAASVGIVRECDEFINADGNADAIDAGLIAMANRMDHYEIAGYGAARAHAAELGMDKHIDLLERTLHEEGETDKKLKAVAGRKNAAATH